MAKNRPIDPELLGRVADVVFDIWTTKGAGFGDRPADMAAPAIRRWQSSGRRGVPADDKLARTQDLARGLSLHGQKIQRGTDTSYMWEFAEAIAEVLDELLD